MNRWHDELLYQVEVCCSEDSGASVDTAIEAIRFAASEGVPIGQVALAAGLSEHEVELVTAHTPRPNGPKAAKAHAEGVPECDQASAKPTGDTRSIEWFGKDDA